MIWWIAPYYIAVKKKDIPTFSHTHTHTHTHTQIWSNLRSIKRKLKQAR